MKTLVVVPTYNEADNLPRLAELLRGLPVPVDMLVVDDNSPDGTGSIAEQLAAGASGMRVYCLHRPRRQGLRAAYQDGFNWAMQPGPDYGIIITMDADLSHPASALPGMIRAIESGAADIVIGSRYVPGGGVENWGLGRRLLSRMGSAYARFITGMPVRDCTAGFVAYSRKALEAVPISSLQSDGYGYAVEFKYRIWKAGLKIAEHPILFTERRVGSSKLTRGIIWEAFWLVWRLRFGGVR